METMDPSQPPLGTLSVKIGSYGRSLTAAQFTAGWRAATQRLREGEDPCVSQHVLEILN